MFSRMLAGRQFSRRFNVVLLVDCRGKKAPPRRSGNTRCLKCATNWHKNEKQFANVCEEVNKLRQEADTEVAVMFFCKRGEVRLLNN